MTSKTGKSCGHLFFSFSKIYFEYFYYNDIIPVYVL